jgi:ribonuclease BN (tRNA processing enzyme)
METNSPTQIILLGTGTPNAEPDRAGSSVALIVNDQPYIFDCGAGVMQRANAAYQKGNLALKPSNLKTLFLTHLHADHTLGLADLILTPWILEREKPLQIFGPQGTQQMTDSLLQAYQEDIRERIEGLQPSNATGYQVQISQIQSGIIYQDENIIVEAFPARHGKFHAFSYRVGSEDLTVVISGDTAPHDMMIEKYTNCDILVHEVYSSAGFQNLPADWQRYHAAMHTSTFELAKVANQAKPSQLVLYHQLTWGQPLESLISEIKQLYSGEVYSAKDLDVFPKNLECISTT